ncbi:MAG TPA: DUF488 domain-containing protein [Anaeromyxobacteraceae bacterium]|jgi:uncharacterized protein (DUF488 family)|nr:DUF488 domain-containing protein [Anaeromyxobacteraceae bacterium]
MARATATRPPPSREPAARPRAAPGWGKARVLAVGHSTRPFAELLALLQSAGVRTLVDVRTIPRSRANPQYEGPALAAGLAAAGVAYVHLARLGGLRHARKDSPNGAWRNASFRGYADHMLTPEFEEGLTELRALARAGPVALMCAEAVPWRCHRSLIADALFARGVVVHHITGKGRTRPHRLTPFARVEGRRVLYPPEPGGDQPSAQARAP